MVTKIEGTRYTRVYACELEPGDITLLNGRVIKVDPFTTFDGQERVRIEFCDDQFTNGIAHGTYRRDTILLTEATNAHTQ